MLIVSWIWQSNEPGDRGVSSAYPRDRFFLTNDYPEMEKLKLMRITPLTLFVSLLASHAIACSCAAPPRAVARAEANSAVFVGRVVLEEVRGEKRIYTFEISETFKGALPMRISVTTHRDEATCGIKFDREKDYLVFCRGGVPDALTTGLCAGNRETGSDAGRSDLGELRKAKIKAA
jgi:hypothetical protein